MSLSRFVKPFSPLFSTLVALFCLTSCRATRLAVYTDYLSHESLASFIVGTPDPYLNNPMVGQRLIVTWTLKKNQLFHNNLHLKLFVRFRDKKEVTLLYPITSPKGTYVYALLNQDYIDHNGILTYKVELTCDDCVLEEWHHQIWTNLILVGEKHQSDSNDDDLDTDTIDWGNDDDFDEDE